MKNFKPVSRTRWRILGLILKAHAEGRTLTIRDISNALGFTFTRSVQDILIGLRKDGLVSWEPNLSRTIRPTCRFISASDLASESRPG